MPRIEVVTEQVRAASGRLGTLPDHLSAAAGLAGASAGAADGTPAAGAYDAMAQAWAGALAAHANALADLARATGLAAECYEAADRLPAPPAS
jgi:hypothetical protein